MKNAWRVGLLAVAMTMGQTALAEEAVAPTASEAEATAKVALTPTGEQVVTVNSGSEVVDAAANYAVKCAEKAAAMRTCDSMGSFKAMGCRKLAEMRYKGVDCPIE